MFTSHPPLVYILIQIFESTLPYSTVQSFHLCIDLSNCCFSSDFPAYVLNAFLISSVCVTGTCELQSDATTEPHFNSKCQVINFRGRPIQKHCNVLSKWYQIPDVCKMGICLHCPASFFRNFQELLKKITSDVANILTQQHRNDSTKAGCSWGAWVRKVIVPKKKK